MTLTYIIINIFFNKRHTEYLRLVCHVCYYALCKILSTWVNFWSKSTHFETITFFSECVDIVDVNAFWKKKGEHNLYHTCTYPYITIDLGEFNMESTKPHAFIEMYIR